MEADRFTAISKSLLKMDSYFFINPLTDISISFYLNYKINPTISLIIVHINFVLHNHFIFCCLKKIIYIKLSIHMIKFMLKF